MLKPGNLVEITRANIGVPLGSVALIVEEQQAHDRYTQWQVYVVNIPGYLHPRCYLEQDLKVISS